MKEIISHRGFWKQQEEKNTMKAFQRALEAGYGIETDLRDMEQRIVVSHDMPSSRQVISIDDLFGLYKNLSSSSTLALNIKSDGLQDQLKSKLEEYHIKNYFVFDMSIPDAIQYSKRDMSVYGRYSDVETEIFMLEDLSGVWVDSFKDDSWLDFNSISNSSGNLPLCVVSSELHGRNHKSLWEKLRSVNLSNIALCTDLPDQAKEFFNV